MQPTTPTPTAPNSLAHDTDRAFEVSQKLALCRRVLHDTGLQALRLRGVDWFAWATAGGSNIVLMASETGVGEVLITADRAYLLTDAIEAQRLETEELAPLLDLIETHAIAWQYPERRAEWLAERGLGDLTLIASDRPDRGERELPLELKRAKLRLTSTEAARYRALGREASAALFEALSAARPTTTERELAGLGARALYARGIEPVVILVAGDARARVHRHPLPTAAAIGTGAMMVFCARRNGLIANLTRFVRFEPPSRDELERLQRLARVEAAILDATKAGAGVARILERARLAYVREGFGEAEIDRHHQGGVTGYLAREAVARPGSALTIETGNAVAWNPSIAGLKLEDTFLVLDGHLENITLGPEWPVFEVEGRPRPLPIVAAAPSGASS